MNSRLTTLKEFFQGQQFPTHDLKNLFSWSYWSENPVPSDSPYTFVTVVIVALLLTGLIIWYLRLRQLQKTVPVYNRAISQLPPIIIFTAVTSLLYTFFRTQEVQYLSSRLLLLTAFLLVLAWSGYLAIYLLKTVPHKKQAYLEKERFFRYLPKKRKNK